MKKIITIFTFSSAFLLIFSYLIFYFGGFHFNHTRSMPLGLYQEIDSSTLDKNDIVLLKIPQKKEILLKKIVAVNGDFVEVNNQGVFINKTLMPDSKIFSFDSEGNPLEFKPFKYKLKENELFVMGENIKSYDSRYFGVVNILQNEVKKVKLLILF
ncbi:signal peptidase I [Campylobacter sp. B0100352/1]|uniref:signal peptidase I n=1 Tax=Campylobacter sp. B0100352/1 TaxID=2735783 RepID=UPI001D9887B0|nr:signal peptidase I [Campylobacter sp. B0100352/1]